MLSDRSLTWLRDIETVVARHELLQVHGCDETRVWPGLDIPATRVVLRAMYACTPAWTERYDALLRDLGFADTDTDAAPPTLSCPQVVGIDFPRISVRRAEWVGGILHVGLVVIDPDPSARTEFRIIGAEPRVWWVSGIDNVTTDVTANTVTVWLPRVSGELEFAPGSY